MRRAWNVIQLVLLPSAALVVALLVAPQRATLEIHIWLLVVLGLAFLALMRLVQTLYPRVPSPFDGSLRRPEVHAERPGSLTRLEREVSMAGSAAFDVHFRLRPVIVELATELLSSRRGIDLERDPDRAHAALGDDVWEIVRPDRPQPTERHGAGIDEAHLGRVVTALEHV
jgi:hypothetical protein